MSASCCRFAGQARRWPARSWAFPSWCGRSGCRLRPPIPSEKAASTLGANPFFRFLLVSLPLAFPGIVVGATLSFARALGEFGATITFVSNIPGETQTIPTLIYTYTQEPGGDENALHLTLVSLAIAIVAIVASEIIQARGEKRLAGGG